MSLKAYTFAVAMPAHTHTHVWFANSFEETTAGFDYKELYRSKWDPITLTNNKSYTLASKFYIYFGLMMACLGQN
jgi:hypothetical protein